MEEIGNGTNGESTYVGKAEEAQIRMEGGEESVGRSESVVVEEVEGGGDLCRYEGCGKVCKSGGGRTIHEKRKHRVSKECDFRVRSV